jgi:ABC-2 type transport system permease protein
MFELIRFSLHRRLFNKASMVFYIVAVVIAFVGVNIDRVLPIFESENVIEVAAPTNIASFIEVNPHLKVKTNPASDIKIVEQDGVYYIDSKDLLDTKTQQFIVTMLEAYHINQLSLVPAGLIEYYDRNIAFNVFFNPPTNTPSPLAGLAFWLITSIYFMMIGYATIVANEVVYEKTTKYLELLLSVVTIRVHFYAKLIIGWMTVMCQLFGIGAIMLSALIWRYQYDIGSGLCHKLIEWGVIENQLIDFKAILNIIQFRKMLLPTLLIFIILFLGLVCVQLWMVILSSFVRSVEEAANWQSPVYILLMLVYYLSLTLQDTDSLSSGMGFLLSFIPITSMLMMPSRLLTIGVSSSELLLCVIIQLLVLLISMALGELVYTKGIMSTHQKNHLFFK